MTIATDTIGDMQEPEYVTVLADQRSRRYVVRKRTATGRLVLEPQLSADELAASAGLKPASSGFTEAFETTYGELLLPADNEG